MDHRFRSIRLPKDTIWEYFEIIEVGPGDEGFCCKHCDAKVANLFYMGSAYSTEGMSVTDPSLWVANHKPWCKLGRPMPPPLTQPDHGIEFRVR